MRSDPAPHWTFKVGHWYPSMSAYRPNFFPSSNQASILFIQSVWLWLSVTAQLSNPMDSSHLTHVAFIFNISTC